MTRNRSDIAESVRFAFILLIIVGAFAASYFAGVRAGIYEDSGDAYRAGISEGKQQIIHTIERQEGGIRKVESSAGGFDYIVPGDFTDH